MSEIKPWREYIGKHDAYIIMCDVLNVLYEKEAIKKTLYERLKQAPSTDRPRGEWIDMGDFERCSVCEGTHLKEFETRYGKALWVKSKYCPNCGARMGGETDGRPNK